MAAPVALVAVLFSTMFARIVSADPEVKCVPARALAAGPSLHDGTCQLAPCLLRAFVAQCAAAFRT